MIEKDTDTLKRSMVASAIIHLVLIIILSICIASKPKETRAKLLQVSRKTSPILATGNKELKEGNTTEGMANKKKAQEEMSERDRTAKQKLVDTSATEPYKGPSVGPETGEQERRGTIGTKKNATDIDVAVIEKALEERVKGLQEKATLDSLRSSLIRYEEKKFQEKVVAMQNDVSHDKAKFLSYAKTYSSFGEERQYNFLIDFSFSSDRIRNRFFQKYDMKSVPMRKVSDIRWANKSRGKASAYFRDYSDNYKYKHYVNKYGEDPWGYVGEKYLYMGPQSIMWETFMVVLAKMVVEKYGVRDSGEIVDFITSHKVVVVYEIDEEKLEFRVREFGFYEVG